MKQSPSLRMQPGLSQILQMEQATWLEMPEAAFQKLIAEIERSPLFQKLHQKEKLICRQRSPRTDISPHFYQLKEAAVADKGSPDVETLLSSKKNVIEYIRRLGIEKFRRYFLFPESAMTDAEIAEECDLPASEVEEINRLIDEISILSEFYHPSTLSSGAIHYSRIASIEKGKDGLAIGYFAPSLARGRYAIDYERFEQLKTSGALRPAEIKQATQLFRKLELINNRKDTINRILQNIIERQVIYLESGDLRTLLPLSQKELAKSIGLAPSSISRAIRDKSIDTPWGQEIPLKHFFPRPRTFKKELLKHLLETEKGLGSDQAIKAKLWEKFGVAISRRSVANLRQELKIPPPRHQGTSLLKARQ